MSEAIDRDTVIEVARLARIEMPNELVADYQQQLARILEYVGQLSQIEIPSGTVPFFGSAESVNAVRPDIITESLTQEVILKNAPASDGEYYLVPPVFQ